MDTKALKKQMGAAIAMVLVAAIALGSATFAWFVTNNKVTAKTSSISAQSNAAFMTIESGTTGASESDKSAATTNAPDATLFPATYGEQADSDQQVHKGAFYYGYGKDANDGTLASALTIVGTKGTPDEAVEARYAQKEEFNVGTKGQNMKDLKVSSVTNSPVSETATDPAANNGSSLMKALRVLIVDGEDTTKWVVYGQADAAETYEVKLSSESDDTVPNFGEIKAGVDHKVNIYLYYEGKDAQVYTNNLNKLTSTNKVTVTLTASANGNGDN